MEVNPPSLLYIGIGFGLLYFLVAFLSHVRVKRKPAQADFYIWGVQSIMFSMGITNGIQLIYFAVTGDVYPGGSESALRIVVGIFGVVLLAAACYVPFTASLGRLKRRIIRR